MCGASRRPVDRLPVREVVSNRTEQMMETAGAAPTRLGAAPAIILLPDGRNADTGFSSLSPFALCFHPFPVSDSSLTHTHPTSDSVRVCAIRKYVEGESYAG